MELALTLVGLGGLYVISNQKEKSSDDENLQDAENIRREGFDSALPNVDIPDKNYPDPTIIKQDLDVTSKLGTVNQYSTPSWGAHTDKYYNPEVGSFNVSPLAGMVNSQKQYESLTGDTVNADYFQHNNMVPFFGSKIRGKTVDLNSNESTLDNYVGAGSQIITKIEQAPLFSPSENVQHAYGAPNMSDFYQSRMVASQSMQGVKPFQSQNVGPGVGLGYGTEGSGGFNSAMENRELWMDKTVDELRPLSNPKASEYGLLGLEGAPKYYNQNTGSIEIHGAVEKNRPDRIFEMSQDRYFTTTGMESAQPGYYTNMNHSGSLYKPTEIVEKHINRAEISAEYGGNPRGEPNSYVTGEYMPSKHMDLGEVPLSVATATGKGVARDGDYAVKSYKAYPNNRTMAAPTAGGDNYFAGMSSAGVIGAVVAPLLDLLRPSRKENTVGNMRPYENVKTRVSNTYIYNPADKPAPTIRQMTERSKGHHWINANQDGGAYMVTEMQIADNNRMNSVAYTGNADSAYTHAPTVYDSVYNRTADVKASTVKGYTPSGNMSLFNGSLNPTYLRNDDSYNTRALTGDRGPVIPVGGEGYGQLSGTHQSLVSNIGYDRSDPSDYQSVLKQNPYVQSYMGL